MSKLLNDRMPEPHSAAAQYVLNYPNARIFTNRIQDEGSSAFLVGVDEVGILIVPASISDKDILLQLVRVRSIFLDWGHVVKIELESVDEHMARKQLVLNHRLK